MKLKAGVRVGCCTAAPNSESHSGHSLCHWSFVFLRRQTNAALFPVCLFPKCQCSAKYQVTLATIESAPVPNSMSRTLARWAARRRMYLMCRRILSRKLKKGPTWQGPAILAKFSILIRPLLCRVNVPAKNHPISQGLWLHISMKENRSGRWRTERVKRRVCCTFRPFGPFLDLFKSKF